MFCSKQQQELSDMTTDTSDVSTSINNNLANQCDMCGQTYSRLASPRKHSSSGDGGYNRNLKKYSLLSRSSTDYFYGAENYQLANSPCFDCRSKLSDLRELNRKYYRLENHVESLTRKMSMLTSMFEQQNLLAPSTVYCYQTFKNNNNNSKTVSPTLTKKKGNFLKNFSRIFSLNKTDATNNNDECKSATKSLLFQNSDCAFSNVQESNGNSKFSPFGCIKKSSSRLSVSSNDRQLPRKRKQLGRSRSLSEQTTSTICRRSVKEFCENTSFHGFSLCHRADNIYMRLLWILVICFSFVGSGYEIYNVVTDYLSTPTSTVYEFETPDDGLIFPEILLCNTNFLNATKARQFNYSKGVVNAAKFMILNPIEDVIGSVFDSTYAYLNRNLADSDRAAGHTFMPDVLENLQYDLNEFVKACFFDQQPCEIFNVSIVEAPDAEYGVCFLVKVNSLQTKSGEGLQLVLDTHSDLFWTEQPTFGHGVAVRIEKTYNPGVLRSYFVLPNYITKISLSAIHYKMLDTSNCRDDMSRVIFNMNVTYSEDICRMECFFRVALKLCGCIRSMPPEYLYEAHLPQCFNSTQQICLKQASVAEKHDQEAQLCKRQCIPPCDSWDYRASLSMLKFPAPPVVPVMEMMYNKSANESRFSDYVVLDIAFDQLRVTNIKQQVAISADGFLSQIGGHLGLFMGASLMSLVHAVVMVFQWFCKMLHKRLRKNNDFTYTNGL